LFGASEELGRAWHLCNLPRVATLWVVAAFEPELDGEGSDDV
jgi:hypothetical protein